MAKAQKTVKDWYYTTLALLAHWHAGLLYLIGRGRKPGKGRKPCRCQRFQAWLEDKVMYSDSRRARRILMRSYKKWP